MTLVENFGRELFKDLLGKDYSKFYVGFDGQLAKMASLHKEIMKNVPNYPPYNIRKTDENKYQIELAVAGFGKQDIEIELEGNKLIVTGNSSTEVPDDTYLIKGIGMRPFTRTFAIDDKIEIQSAELVNGMLKIILEKIIPEDQKPKKISIKD